MTLLEILLASTLVLILLGLVAAVLIPTLRLTARDTQKVELQESVSLSIEKLSRELKQAAPATIAVHQSTGPGDPTVVAMIQVEDVSPEAKLLWETEFIVYYFIPNDGRLYRRIWTSGLGTPDIPLTPDLPRKPTQAELVQMAQSSQGGTRMLARNITDFTVDTGPGPGISQPISVSLSAEQELADNRKIEFSMLRSLYLEHGGAGE